MTEPAKIARRLCLAAGIAFLIFGFALGLAYHLHYRQMWSPEVIGPAARLLNDPSAPIESVRNTALQGHRTLLASFEVIDAAILMLLIASAAAGIAFLYVFAVLRRRRHDGAL
jgi:hypothetical protein